MIDSGVSSTALDVIAALRVVPVVVIPDAARAHDLAGALVAGGLPIAEVTLRTDVALEALRAMAQVPGLCAGAGTVVTAAQVDRVVDAGAQFVVSPGLSPSVAARCGEHGVPYLPGVATATEIMAALDLGIELVKFFPAEQLGGLATIRALHAPFPSVSFVPSGGIDVDLAPAYLAHPAVTAVGGSWMVPPPLVTAGDWVGIADLASAALTLAAWGRTPARGQTRA
jgi:2-dehydro-3-deoxyphosphogluconate aldolase / (4S)-4-hydroxy-2-oxoglutarate aldolase